jgi:hypothetical protein
MHHYLEVEEVIEEKSLEMRVVGELKEVKTC